MITETRKGSSIVRVPQSDGGTRRIGKLLGLQGMSLSSVDPVTGEMERVFTNDLFYSAVASFLAAKEFNERSGTILPHLPGLLQGCDFYWSYEYRDGQQQSREATKQLMEALDLAYYHRPEDSALDGSKEKPSIDAANASAPSITYATTKEAARYLEPFAVFGAYWSRVSQTLSIVTGSLEIPYMTGGSTSTALDGTPYFARTIPTNDADARAMMLYYRSLGVSHVALLYLKDAWGSSYHQRAQYYASHFNITTASFSYDPNPDSIRSAIESLQASQYRYIFAMMWPWEDVVPIAYEYGIMGHPEYAWMAADLKQWVGDDFRVEDQDLAKALHGAGTINIYAESHNLFEYAMEQTYYFKALQQEFIDIQQDPSIFENFTWPAYDPSQVANTVFDAVMALGLTACNASVEPLFTGKAFYEALLHTEFKGVSGQVQFDHKTGTRISSYVQYSVEYISLIDDAHQERQFGSDDSVQGNRFRFQSNMVAVIQGDNIEFTQHPFVYNDNSITQPSALPPLDYQDLNVLPQWAQVMGYCLGGFLAALSVMFYFWTATRKSKVDVLIASQPFFLCQLCVGTFIVALTVYPMSLPGASTETDDSKMMDIACMSSIWLLILGFSIAFSALACKIYRVNRIIATGVVFQRATVEVKDVMLPFYISLAMNTSLLLCLSFLGPLQYQHVQLEQYDQFHRSFGSYGTCRPSNGKTVYILGAMGATNFMSVILVAYQAYKARDYPDDFSDVRSLSLAILSLLEAILLGLPFVLVTKNDPKAMYLVFASLLSVSFVSVLMLIFVPKFQMRKRRFNRSTLAPAFARASSKRSNNGSYRNSTTRGSTLHDDTMIDHSKGHQAIVRINPDSQTFR